MCAVSFAHVRLVSNHAHAHALGRRSMHGCFAHAEIESNNYDAEGICTWVFGPVAGALWPTIWTTVSAIPT